MNVFCTPQTCTGTIKKYFVCKCCIIYNKVNDKTLIYEHSANFAYEVSNFVRRCCVKCKYTIKCATRIYKAPSYVWYFMKDCVNLNYQVYGL